MTRARLRRTVAGLVLLIILATSASADIILRERPLYLVGDDAFPPFSFESDGRIQGIDCDIIREMARRMGVSVTIELVPWRRLIELIRTGGCDGGFSLFSTPERRRFARFADGTPIHESTFYLYVRPEGAFRFESLDDLAGKAIGVNRGFFISCDFDRAVAEGRFSLDAVEGVTVNLRKLAAGRIDGFVANADEVSYCRRACGDDLIPVVALPRPVVERRGAYLVLSRKGPLADPEEMIRRIEAALAAMVADGTRDRIIRRYLPPPEAAGAPSTQPAGPR